jgi:hypothetical protein
VKNLLLIVNAVLGIMCAVMDGSPLGDDEDPNNPNGKIGSFNQALIVAITSWPIVFAAIAAQSLKALAAYKVERGIRLMVSKCTSPSKDNY